MDCRVEMGWHSFADDPPEPANIHLVARRRTDERSFSGTRIHGWTAARGDCSRWRDSSLEGRPAAAVRTDAEAHRAQGAGAEDPGRSASGAAGLRSAGVARRRCSRVAYRATPAGVGGTGGIIR